MPEHIIEERLARLEERLATLEKKADSLIVDMREIQKTIWKAGGALAVVWSIVQCAGQFLRH